MIQSVSARVPASSANLGPGFDSLAAALSPVLELEVARTGSFSVSCDTDGVPTDRSNLCVQAFASLAPVDELSFEIRSQVPVSAGLGSSAAAIVAGLCCADRMHALGAPLARRAVELEGHPDNVSAALYGGFVICTPDHAERLEPPAGLEAVLCIPPEQVATASARAALPREVPITDAVYNTAHAALLVSGLVRGDLELVARGLSDRIHQSRREHLYPRSMQLVRDARRLGALGATISGAGPTVLFWTEASDAQRLSERLSAEAFDCEVEPASFVAQGARVEVPAAG